MHKHDSIYLLNIGFSRIILANLTDRDKILQAYVGWTQISRVKILLPEPKKQNGGEKWVFCSGYNKLICFVTGQIGMKFGKNTSIGVLYWTLIEEFWKFSLKGRFCPKTAIFGLFWRVSVHVTDLQVVFRLSKAFRASGVPTLNGFFCATYSFGYKPIKLSKFR